MWSGKAEGYKETETDDEDEDQRDKHSESRRVQCDGRKILSAGRHETGHADEVECW